MTVLCAHAEARIQAQVSAEQQLGRAIRIAEHMPCGAQIFVPRVLCLIAHDFQARKMYVCVCCICVCVLCLLVAFLVSLTALAQVRLR